MGVTPNFNDASVYLAISNGGGAGLEVKEYKSGLSVGESALEKVVRTSEGMGRTLGRGGEESLRRKWIGLWRGGGLRRDSEWY